ncbi:very short patch repair endonuclease [Rhodoplanes sp. SY1]|uniref:very short patch repair endonuclease n=1 Tax=Rhodoplanes sp. SY1 TaxID=3166646 RepID=UPI0038B5AA94
MKPPVCERPIDPKRSVLMRRVRQRRTKPEDDVAAVLRKLKLGYRRNVRSLPGSPDFANKRRKWAVFVNGCFWHRHEGCARTTTPSRNRDFWVAKFDSNVRRDAIKAEALRKLGFRVVVVWECETIDALGLERQLLSLNSR